MIAMQLRRLSCLEHNERLSELYLHDNRLDSIAGALRHLTSLKVLFLHNIQLRQLASVVREFSKMQTLLNLSNEDNYL
jgi:Leucine-rich repeat (LRR) protein